MSTNTDFPKFIATQLADLIKQADTKATATFYVLGITAAALLARLTATKLNNAGNVVWMGLFVIAAILILVALKTIITVIYPRLGKGSKKGFIYFKDITSQSLAEYVERGRRVSEEETVTLLYEHAHNLARISEAKFRALRYALILTGVAIVWAMFVLLLA